MHIPDYARSVVRGALPRVPTSRHVRALDCCFCNAPFGEELAAVPLGPTETSGLFGCRPCLKRLITRARRSRDESLVRNARQKRTDETTWERTREHHLSELDRLREATEAVSQLAEGGAVEALQIAWLLISLESAYDWFPDCPEPPATVDDSEAGLRDEAFALDLAMIKARESVSERLAYHLINEARSAEPEMCAELECPEGCSGRHDSTHVDCGPDEIFEDLARHGVHLEQSEPELPSSLQAAGPGGEDDEDDEDDEDWYAAVEEYAPRALAHVGIDVEDTDALLNAAAVGLVADAWRQGPMEAIHAADDGPSDGEIFAQSVDLYRRARAALAAAREDGPEALRAFVAVASDVRLPWAGGSSFSLRMLSGSVADFVQQVDDRVWFTGEMMRKRSWRTALLYRAVSAAAKAPRHFGMPGWPGTVSTAMERLAAVDPSDRPDAMTDLPATEAALLRAPDKLSAETLGWIIAHGLLA